MAEIILKLEKTSPMLEKKTVAGEGFLRPRGNQHRHLVGEFLPDPAAICPHQMRSKWKIINWTVKVYVARERGGGRGYKKFFYKMRSVYEISSQRQCQSPFIKVVRT